MKKLAPAILAAIVFGGFVLAQTFGPTTGTPFSILSTTADGVTSGTVGAVLIQATTNLTDGDLILDIQNSAAGHAFTVNEQGAIVALAGLTATTGTFSAALSGLTLTGIQGGADAFPMRLTSTDVATGVTTAASIGEATGLYNDAATNDYFAMGKASATLGGVGMVALAENDVISPTFGFTSVGGTATTTKSTAGLGLFHFFVLETDGANGLDNITADGNVFSIGARVGGGNSTVWIADEDGDTWQNGSATMTSITISTDLTLIQGGTNASLTAANGGAVYSSASALAITAAGTAGQVLRSAGAAAPTWGSGLGVRTPIADLVILSAAAGCSTVTSGVTCSAGQHVEITPTAWNAVYASGQLSAYCSDVDTVTTVWCVPGAVAADPADTLDYNFDVTTP